MNLLSPKARGADPPFPTSFREARGITWWSSIQGRTVQSANQGEAPPKSGSNTIISGESKTVPNHPTTRSAPCSSRSNTAKPLSSRAVNSAWPFFLGCLLEPVRVTLTMEQDIIVEVPIQNEIKLTTPKIGTYSRNGGIMSSKGIPPRFQTVFPLLPRVCPASRNSTLILMSKTCLPRFGRIPSSI